jgi:EmrB/QacA subfamily drug resistance transporter
VDSVAGCSISEIRHWLGHPHAINKRVSVLATRTLDPKFVEMRGSRGWKMTTQRWTLAAAVLGSGMVFLDSTIVNVALPQINRELPGIVVAPLEGLAYIYNGYLMSFSSILILAGGLADHYGRRRMFVIGLVGFGATSILCGLAPNMEILILLRVAQGASGAFVVPASLAILNAAFSSENRGRAFGVWAGASAATTVLGPPIGGLLVQALSWRAVFLVNAPIVILAAWICLKYVSESRGKNSRGRFDLFGALDIALAVGGISFGLIYGGERNWRDPIAHVSIAIGLVALAAFPFLMRRSDPLVPLHLLRNRNFAVINISSFLIFGGLYIEFYYILLFAQGTLGYTAVAAGLLGLPGSMLVVLLSPTFGALAGRVGPRRFMAIGPGIMAVSLLWLARVPVTSSAWRIDLADAQTLLPPAAYVIDFLPATLLFGLGASMFFAPIAIALMDSVPVANAGLASAVNNAVSRLAPQISGGIVFIAITSSFYGSIASAAPGVDETALHEVLSPLSAVPSSLPAALIVAAQEASTSAFHLSMLVSATLLAAGGLVNAVAVSSTGTGVSGIRATPHGSA